MHNKFILGTMRLDQNDIDQSIKLFERANKLGIEYLDTADIYGNYTMNSHIGEVLQLDQSFRDFKIIGKCGICSPKDSRWSTKHYNNSDFYLKACIDKMLNDFHTDFIDTLLIHRPSPIVKYSQLAKTIRDLKDQKLIKNFGVSNFSITEVNGLMQYTEVCDNQIEMSPVNFDNYDNGLLTFSQTSNLNVQFWSPLAGGKVFEKNSQIFAVLDKYSKLFNVSHEAIVYKFLLMFPVNSRIVLGTTKAIRLDAITEVERIHLTEEMWFEIAQAGGKYVAK